MGEFRGRMCDRPGCNTVVENINNMPDGWIQVIPKASHDKTPADAAFELCSNECVVLLFADRLEAETGKVTKIRKPRNITPEGREMMRLNGKIRGEQHRAEMAARKEA